MGIVHLAGPWVRDDDGGPQDGHQACSLCGTVLPPIDPPWEPQRRCWQTDQLVTVTGDRATLGAEKGAVRCSLKLLEPQEDGA